MERDPGGIKPFRDFIADLQSAKHENFATLVDSRVRGTDAFEEQRQHLLKLYSGMQVDHSFADEAGQVFDCVPIEQQPALKATGGRPATPPSIPPRSSPAAQPPVVSAAAPAAERKDRYGNDLTCPGGTVPLRRVTLEEITRFETLAHFLRKHGQPRRRQGSIVAPEADATPHEYAHASQRVNNIGGHSVLGLWAPAVASPSIFSLSQHWYVNDTQGPVQTVEVGWQVYPGMYGHAQPVLFTYWTADGYNNTGAYNNTAGNFVQVGATYAPGMALETWSQVGGAQVELELLVMLQNGNWWVFVNGTDAASAMGYYPTSLYNGGPLANGATVVDYGGETVGQGQYPPMGSGEFSARGYKYAAYHRNIYFLTSATTSTDASLTAYQSTPASYTIDVANSNGWGEYFYFGGPGGPGSSPQVARAAPTAGNLVLTGPYGTRIEGLSVDDAAALLRRLGGP